MRLEGRREKRQRLVQGGGLIVEVEVEVVYPIDDPSEACYEPEVINFLRDVRLRAEAGDREWLRKVGRVYVLESAA